MIVCVQHVRMQVGRCETCAGACVVAYDIDEESHVRQRGQAGDFLACERYGEMARVIGLTGNIACGKTTVGRMLLELGAERYIDADALVHQLYERGQPLALRIAEVFGVHMLTAEGSVDRKALGALVFRDVQAMQRLEQIVHPAVNVAVRAELERVSPEGVAILDAVKLFEGSSAALCQSKWLVICSEEQELARLRARNHLTLEEAQLRIQAQPSVASRLVLADEVIDNSLTVQDTQQQVRAAYTRFLSLMS